MAPKQEKTGLERAKNTEHVLVDVGTVSGAVAGAVVGIVAGPPGMIVGGAIGAALGTAAGTVLDRESHMGDQRDRALDDEIGVTSGDIGARDIVRRSFTEKNEMAEANRRALEAELEGEEKVS